MNPLLLAAESPPWRRAAGFFTLSLALEALALAASGSLRYAPPHVALAERPVTIEWTTTEPLAAVSQEGSLAPPPAPSPREAPRKMATPETETAEAPGPVPEAQPEETSAPAASVPPSEAPASVAPLAGKIAALARPDYLNNPKPDYPLLARRRGIVGRVLLRVLVRADGTPGEVSVAQSSGHAMLDRAARSAVAAWRFVPARRGEQTIESWAEVPVSFRLEGGTGGMNSPMKPPALPLRADSQPIMFNQ